MIRSTVDPKRVARALTEAPALISLPGSQSTTANNHQLHKIISKMSSLGDLSIGSIFNVKGKVGKTLHYISAFSNKLLHGVF